ncbi:zinc finger protein 84-like [Argiope bruennichi]|uniref:zinc finger protein 84-like n=1 Tax=Argiope bruennichi TaxID=94029 RepID=UPI0024947A79|nr:zinc finger protein 84-like [Argiope bruennichi]
MQVSECVNDEHISLEVHSQVHSKKTKMATYVKELHSAKKDDNAVAEPSGICLRKNPLKLNYQTQTGNEPFMCNICKKKFSTKSHFDRHYRMHTGEKPYECGIFGKKCSRKENFIIHYRIHTGERPYVCNFCNKDFAEMAILKYMPGRTLEKGHINIQLVKSLSQTAAIVKVITKESTSDTNLRSTEIILLY